MLQVQEYINHFLQVWENTPSSFPEFSKVYSYEEKREREKNFQRFYSRIKEMQGGKNIKQLRNDITQSFFPIIKDFLKTVFDFDDHHLNLILADSFTNVSKDFYYKARSFAPELKPESIYQAMRNVWIMNGIQLIADVPVKITHSVFAYSMIYPYSDNLLDDPKITDAEKYEFSERFNKCLHGETIMAESFTEQQLFNLVKMFEEEYSRCTFPKVFESLYAIQKGQTKSLQMIHANDLSKKHIQSICFEKGGASVLADGYLVVGKLTPQQEQALFGFGVYLQLLDDIQDIEEDLMANTKTMYSHLHKNELGEKINKTIHFGRQVLNDMHCFSGVEKNDFLSLMNTSIERMLIESVGLNSCRYNQDFLNEIEKYSPLHFEFVQEKRVQGKSQRFELFKRYFSSSQKAKQTVEF